MQEEILVNVNRFETRVALTQAGAVHELHLERASRGSVTGNIYRGRVQRILPGMQAAFVDIGLARPGFLHARDIARSLLHTAEPTAPGPAGHPEIQGLVHEGQTVTVQVAKDPIGTKGARLTTALSIPSRFLVLMPPVAGGAPGDSAADGGHIGVSQRIEDEAERERLRTAAAEARTAEGLPEAAGCILRTAAEGASADDVRADMRFLRRVWATVQQELTTAGVPALVHEDLPVHIRVLRDLVGSRLHRVVVDDRATCDAVRNFAARFLPELKDSVELHDDRQPLFERYGVEEELARALDARVPLKSGGHLVIEQTEAMTTVDVNTGGYVGRTNLEETVYRTNLEAAAMVPRQLRLRNLGGIIIIDFIDMHDPEHQRQVLRTLEKACELDRVPVRVSGLSALGLVEMSRKRTRESLARQLCEPCPACNGLGRVRTPESVCSDVFRAMLRDARRRVASAQDTPPAECDAVLALDGLAAGGEYLVRAAPAVVDRLLDEDAATVADISRQVGLPIRFQVEPMYTAEQFDIVLMQDIRRQGGG